MKFELIKKPSDFWEKDVCGSLKLVALDERSLDSMTFGTYIKPLSH